MTYQFYWDGQSSDTPLHFLSSVYDSGGVTPVSFVPAIYFKADVLPRLYGLSLDGLTWTEIESTPTRLTNGSIPTVTATDAGYFPSMFRFRAMAYMKQDMGWGVALYGRWNMNQVCETQFPMSWVAHTAQCPNFVAQKFPSSGVNNVSLVDQTIGSIAVGTYKERTAHLVVGNLDTIQRFVNRIFDAGH